MSSDVLTMWPNNSRPFFQCALCWRNSVRLSSSVIATGPAIAMTSGFTASTQPAAALFRDYIEQHGRHALRVGRVDALRHDGGPGPEHANGRVQLLAHSIQVGRFGQLQGQSNGL